MASTLEHRVQLGIIEAIRAYRRTFGCLHKPNILASLKSRLSSGKDLEILMAQSLPLATSVTVRGGGTLSDKVVVEGAMAEDSLSPVLECAGDPNLAA